MRLGMICRFDNSGLGSLSWEFARHLKPSKVLLVENAVFQTFPERYAELTTRRVPGGSTMSQDDRNWILEDVDVLLSIETFYSYDLVRDAKQKGVKTVLVTMFEMMPDQVPIRPDHYLCPSTLDYKVLSGPKTYLPIPLATDRLIWNERKEAKTFIHTASHGGMNGRKGTGLFIEAMKYVKSDIKVLINTWNPFVCEDPRVEVRQKNFKNYWQAWREGDVLVYPQDYNGICLPVSEAFASGLGLVTTDIEPFNEWLPEECLFKPTSMYKTRAAHGLIEVDAAKIDPQVIAAKIDEIAGMDLRPMSAKGKKYAQENSWDVLLPKYQSFLESI